MNPREVKRRLNIAISIFFENDKYLLENDVYERTITHKLAEYLQILFNQYNVDCEYNKNVEHKTGNHDGYKTIITLQNEIERLNLAQDEESKERLVYPDIIIHKRGNNENNLLIIEVKKDSEKKKEKIDFDYLKLVKYTERASDFKYGLGAFIMFSTLVPNPIVTKLDYFQEGEVI